MHSRYSATTYCRFIKWAKPPACSANLSSKWMRALKSTLAWLAHHLLDVVTCTAYATHSEWQSLNNRFKLASIHLKRQQHPHANLRQNLSHIAELSTCVPVSALPVPGCEPPKMRKIVSFKPPRISSGLAASLDSAYVRSFTGNIWELAQSCAILHPNGRMNSFVTFVIRALCAEPESGLELVQPMPSVARAEKEARSSRVALSCLSSRESFRIRLEGACGSRGSNRSGQPGAPATQLVVDAPGLVALRAQHLRCHVTQNDPSKPRNQIGRQAPFSMVRARFSINGAARLFKESTKLTLDTKKMTRLRIY